jgi:SRSO17 transposase
MEANIETGTSILEHPKALALLEQTNLSAAAVRGCKAHLTRFLCRYLPIFYRKEQRENAVVMVEGLLSGLERKTCEPIAREHGRPRKPVQFFVGNGAWNDEAVMAELRRHVKEELGDPKAVMVLDPSSFAKKGSESCGVKRQWCSGLGKTENCQVGVFLCYASPKGHAPLDRQLYLPQEWAVDAQRRDKTHVPPSVRFGERWRMGLDLLDRCSKEGLPHAWVTGDDEFGRCSVFRQALRERGERYILDIPASTLIRDVQGRRPSKRPGRGARPKLPFVQVRQWAALQPASAWRKVRVRPGAKQVLQVQVMTRRVQTRQDRRLGPQERLLVVRQQVAVEQWEIYYSLSNAAESVGGKELAQARAQRHRIEQMLQEAKGETGLGHYEVRSWVGWHHHMTLALLALWFLLEEKNRLAGKKMSGDDGTTGTGNLLEPIA